MTTKILTLAAGLMLAATTVNAQQYNEGPKDEISVSYGMVPVSHAIDAIANALATAITAPISSAFGEDPQLQDRRCFGVINVDYNHHISPAFAIGANASYSTIAADITGTVNGVKQKTGTDKETYLTVMPTIKWDWFRRKNVTLYSRVSAGVMFKFQRDRAASSTNDSNKASKTEAFMMAQVSPIGVEVGSNNLRGFAEAGIGQAGFLQVGARVRF